MAIRITSVRIIGVVLYIQNYGLKSPVGGRTVCELEGNIKQYLKEIV
jgi:hypothetical protein